MINKRIKQNYITIFLALTILTLIVLLSAFIISANVDAHREQDKIKLVKSIKIEEGDTLWKIAKEYNKSDEYSNIQDYIDEIKKSNHLYSDEIHAGKYIILPYYCDIKN